MGSIFYMGGAARSTPMRAYPYGCRAEKPENYQDLSRKSGLEIGKIIPRESRSCPKEGYVKHCGAVDFLNNEQKGIGYSRIWMRCTRSCIRISGGIWTILWMRGRGYMRMERKQNAFTFTDNRAGMFVMLSFEGTTWE